MKKKSLTLILSFSLVFTVFSQTTDAAEITDMPEDWSTKALERAVSAGLLKGDGGRIRPGDSLTRAEMATVINRAFEAEEEASLERYIDVERGDWFYSDMAKAVEMGTFKGDGERLEPNKPISRQEAFVVMARALELEGSKDKPEGLTDLEDLASWAREEVYSLIDAGYIKGSGRKLNPQGEITRAEFAQLLDNITGETETEEVEEKLESYNLRASANKIDLNPSTDDDKIEFTLEKSSLENMKNTEDK